MVVAAGIPVTIMIYGDLKNGVVITCHGTGSEDIPPVTEGERVDIVILGAFTVDVKNTDPSALEKIEDVVWFPRLSINRERLFCLTGEN